MHINIRKIFIYIVLITILSVRALPTKKEEQISVQTLWGTLIFQKDLYLSPFGRRITMIIPRHGDFTCQCPLCSLFHITEIYRKQGYELLQFIKVKNRTGFNKNIDFNEL